jgi:3D (Asp-Asp-Asp) domain-containing protein
MQGSGQALNGALIQYDRGSGTWNVVDQILAADQSAPVAGQTVSRDRAIIPMGGVYVSVSGVGDNLLANDTGKSIVGYRVDLFMGNGRGVCANFNNVIGVGACSPANSACPGSTLQ